MKVISVNIGATTLISWRGKQVKTGIYKYPVEDAIHLGLEDVKGDDVVDRRFHGGVDKACYLYAVEYYSYWKELYPELDWNYGMFGENLSVLGLDERLIKIGSVYELGTAVLQITQPRQPCYKLGVRFGTQKILKQFIASYYSGIYVKVISPGVVRAGDILVLQEEHKEGLTVKELFGLLYDPKASIELAKKALNDPFVTSNNKESIQKRFKEHL